VLLGIEQILDELFAGPASDDLDLHVASGTRQEVDQPAREIEDVDRLAHLR
jgi:hypothetical protein